MSAKEGLFDVTKSDEAAIWLWRAHNIVNKRLAGDMTEDPKHPKVQFPTRTQCPACFSGKKYFEPIIISFLHSFYGKAAMKLDSLTTDEAVAAGRGLQPTAVNTMRLTGSIHPILHPYITSPAVIVDPCVARPPLPWEVQLPELLPPIPSTWFPSRT